MSIPTQTASLRDWALWYAAHGHPVLPIHTPTETGCSCHKAACPNVGKHPRTMHGLLEATTDTTTVGHWWTQWPMANIGLRTGIAFWVLDVDPRKGGDAELAMLEATHAQLPQTPRTITGGGGAHILFALPPQRTIRNNVEIVPGLDVRGMGGYIVAPPSVHASGHTYTWELTAELEETPLAPAPPWLLDLISQPTQHAPVSPEGPIGEGRRNETLSRMAYSMRTSGMSLEEILTAIRAVNARCVPPLDEEELKILAYGKRDIQPDPILRTSKNGTLAQQGARTWPTLEQGTSLLSQQFPARRWILPGLIEEGLTVIGGAPKSAKSYLVLDIALACAGHGLGLGSLGVLRGRAAYFGIEQDPSDSQDAMRQLRPGIQEANDVYFLHGEDVPSISNGLLEYLRLQVTTLQLSIVIIDPVGYIYDPPHGKHIDSFREAKDMLLPLRQLARELHFALILVDHRRKQSKDDVDIFQTLYGSTGKFAIADTLLMLTRDNTDVTLFCRGRHIKDQVISCRFTLEDSIARWEVLGAGDDFHKETLEKKILDAFREGERLFARRVLSLPEITTLLELPATPPNRERVRVALFTLSKKGKVLKTDRNMYTLTGIDDRQGIEL